MNLIKPVVDVVDMNQNGIWNIRLKGKKVLSRKWDTKKWKEKQHSVQDPNYHIIDIILITEMVKLNGDDGDGDDAIQGAQQNNLVWFDIDTLFLLK